MKVKFYTLGCKVNQYETQAMSEALAKRGYEIVSGGDADIFIINSCTVTATADQKTRNAVRRFKKSNPLGTVVLTGCMPQAYPEKAKELIEADIVLGNKTNVSLCDTLEQYFKCEGRVFNICEHKTGDLFCGDSITDFEERTRASVKIQDGCNRFCSYCIIPYSRGRVRSKPLDELKKELRALSENGFSEVVLVGINLSSYGSDIGLTFPDAVEAAENTEGILRVRLGSLEPDHLTDEVIERLAKCKKLCPQFHISLQSGCDSTLKRMNRHYTAEEYRKIAVKLRESFENCTLTTDVMVGFAGETDEDFSECLDFVKEIGFEKVHVFPYSVREGTRAAKFPDQVDKKTKESRCKTMISLCSDMRRTFFEKQKGKVYSVLFETQEGGFAVGHTANYIPVKAKVKAFRRGMICDIKITDFSSEDFCIGEEI